MKIHDVNRLVGEVQGLHVLAAGEGWELYGFLNPGGGGGRVKPRSVWRIAAVLAVLASPPIAARQIAIPFASGGITAAATADPDEPRRPVDAERPALVRIWKRVTTVPAAFLRKVHVRRQTGSGVIKGQPQTFLPSCPWCPLC